jgi:acyl carrier protein
LLSDATPLIADDSKQLELELRDVVARLLKFPVIEVSARAHFFDLGFDSISLTRLATEINTIYGS